MGKVVCFGEIMLCLSPEGYLKFGQANKMNVNYSGAEANVCVALGLNGIPNEFVTKIPKNEISSCALRSLKKFDVGLNHLIYGGDRLGVYFIEKGASQRASKVLYDRKYSSIAMASVEEFDWDSILEGASFFHFTGITAALGENLPEILLRACKTARRLGVKVSCDLNYRKNLWSTQKAQEVMQQLVNYVDILIGNEEDAEKVLGIKAAGTDVTQAQLDHEGYIDVAKQICEKYGCETVGITLRTSISASFNKWAAMLYTEGKAFFSKEYNIQIVDRVGGGDSFASGLIYSMYHGFDKRKSLEYATAASCLKQTIEYDFNLAMADEIEALMLGDGSGRVQR